MGARPHSGDPPLLDPGRHGHSWLRSGCLLDCAAHGITGWRGVALCGGYGGVAEEPLHGKDVSLDAVGSGSEAVAQRVQAPARGQYLGGELGCPSWGDVSAFAAGQQPTLAVARGHGAYEAGKLAGEGDNAVVPTFGVHD